MCMLAAWTDVVPSRHVVAITPRGIPQRCRRAPGAYDLKDAIGCFARLTPCNSNTECELPGALFVCLQGRVAMGVRHRLRKRRVRPWPNCRLDSVPLPPPVSIMVSSSTAQTNVPCAHDHRRGKYAQPVSPLHQRPSPQDSQLVGRLFCNLVRLPISIEVARRCDPDIPSINMSVVSPFAYKHRRRTFSATCCSLKPCLTMRQSPTMSAVAECAHD